MDVKVSCIIWHTRGLTPREEFGTLGINGGNLGYVVEKIC